MSLVTNFTNTDLPALSDHWFEYWFSVVFQTGLDLLVESWLELFAQTRHLLILVGILVTIVIIQFLYICHIRTSGNLDRLSIIQLKDAHLIEIDYLKTLHRLHDIAVRESQRTAIAALAQCIQHNAFVSPRTHTIATQFTSNAVEHICGKFQSFPHRDVVTGPHPFTDTLHPRQPHRAWIARGSGQKLHSSENCPGLVASTSTESLSDTCSFCNKRTKDYNNSCPPADRFFTVEEF